ncbi:MAG TPA: TPM domain-containing protein [Phycisphaerae bacterium]|nr:TPM domain-containing protein [Phycisphaerae bacterium]
MRYNTMPQPYFRPEGATDCSHGWSEAQPVDSMRWFAVRSKGAADLFEGADPMSVVPSFSPRLLIGMVALCLFLPTSAFAVPETTPLIGVVDEASIIDSATEKALNAILLELEQKKLAQMRILTIQTTGGRDLHDYAMELARAWKLGSAEKDNGVLMVIAVADRKYQTITGEGIEGPLTDGFLGDTQRDHIVPNFRRGNYAMGIYEATNAISQRIASDAGVSLTGAAAPVQPRASRGSRRGVRAGGMACFIFLVIAMMVIGSISRRGRRGGRRRGGWGAGDLLTGMILGSLLNSGRRGGGWGGSSGGSFGGGGGFGGFGGGGGGSFGGGGAGGSW